MSLLPLLPLLPLLAVACNREDVTANAISGMVGGQAFAPDLVVFDEVGPAPEDTVAPLELLAEIALASDPDACPLLGALHHLAWLRCESACNGLFAQQERWPAGALRVVWLGVTAGESATGHYDLAMNDSPGVFTARYRPVDLSRLAGLDAKTCLTACSEDRDFLWSGTDDGQWGALEVDTWEEDALGGSLDLLFSTGDLQGTFEAVRCEMGLY
ncbi:MAG: hypothetical protein ABIO70_21175 [Pseudomonadota bacterium]